MAKVKQKVQSTSRYLDIQEIKDDVVVLRDGGMRAVLLVSSINFALKGEDEQNAILQGYLSLLNSLDFSMQIVVQSRMLNIDAYLSDLERRASEQTNDFFTLEKSFDGENFSEFTQVTSQGNSNVTQSYSAIDYSPFNSLSFGEGWGEVFEAHLFKMFII